MKKILIVDDEPSIRKFLETVFKFKFTNYETITAEDGEIALNKAREHISDLDLIIMDTDMPKLNGDEVCERLKKEGYTVPIIGMSGKIENKTKWEKASADDYLEKPFEFNILLYTVRNYLKE